MPVIVSGPVSSPYKALSWVRTQVSRLVEGRSGFYAGTASGGTTTTLTDSRLARYAGQPDYWKHAEIHFLTGSNAGESRLVSASAAGLTWSTALSNAVEDGDTYELRKQVDAAHVDDVIRKAIHDAFPLVFVEHEDTSLVWDEDTESYAIPEDFTHLYEVAYTDDEGITKAIRFNHWRVQGEQLRLDADAMGQFDDDRTTITLRGYRHPALVESDDDLVEVNVPYVIWYAVASLRGEGFSSNAMDPDDDARAFSTFMQFDASRLPLIRTPLRPNTKFVRD